MLVIPNFPYFILWRHAHSIDVYNIVVDWIHTEVKMLFFYQSDRRRGNFMKQCATHIIHVFILVYYPFSIVLNVAHTRNLDNCSYWRFLGNLSATRLFSMLPVSLYRFLYIESWEYSSLAYPLPWYILQRRDFQCHADLMSDFRRSETPHSFQNRYYLFGSEC